MGLVYLLNMLSSLNKYIIIIIIIIIIIMTYAWRTMRYRDDHVALL